MNIFFRELRAHYRGMLGWSVAMAFTVVSGMVKFQGYSTTPGKSGNISEIVNAFPKPVLAVMGITGLDITKIIGAFGVMYLYIVLIAAIYGALSGASLSDEERDRTSEFLYPKPVSRSRVLTEKIMAQVFYQLIFWAVTVASSIWIVDYYDKSSRLNGQVMTLLLGVLLFQLISYAFGAFFAGLFKNPKLPAAAVTTVVVASYLVYVAAAVSTSIDWLKYFTPFWYFGAAKILGDGHLDPFYVSLIMVLSAVLLVLTYVFYNKRDLTV
jgi:ABC-2 type transport system permease protein